jgi:RNA polymerase sigma-70 factor (ECF subfamily)
MSTFGSSTGLLGSAAASRSTAAQSAELQAEVLVLYDALQGRLLRYAMSFGLSKQDGEDVLQEVFLALFRHLQMGRPADNLPGWTYRTTHNLALKRRASLHTEWHASAGDDLVDQHRDNAPGPEENLLFRERQHRLRSVLRVLPENDQVCLRLRADGCRYREIASIVGISLGSVAASLARSFERLRRMDSR